VRSAQINLLSPPERTRPSPRFCDPKAVSARTSPSGPHCQRSSLPSRTGCPVAALAAPRPDPVSLARLTSWRGAKLAAHPTPSQRFL